MHHDLRENDITFGHAYERLWNLPHGLAVACGIKVILKNFSFSPLLVAEYESLMDHLGLKDVLALHPFEAPSLEDAKTCLELIRKDKKARDADSIDLVVLKDIGSPEIRRTAFSEIEKILQTSGTCSS